jgi:hypothetical protein
LENPPRNSGQEVSDQNHLDIDSEEENEYACCHTHHSDHVDSSVAVLGLSPSVDEETDNLTTGGCVVDTGLPIGGNQEFSGSWVN